MVTLRAHQWAVRYRCLQLLQKNSNDTLKYILAALKILFLLGTIRCIYGIIKMNGYLRVFNLSVAAGYVGFLIVFFKALGEVYDKSEKVLLKQRSMPHDKWFRRFLLSCKPLKFEVAGLYFVDPPMSLTMGSFVIQNVANMLILKS